LASEQRGLKTSGQPHLNCGFVRKKINGNVMPDHKVNIPTHREGRPWWRTWKDYPIPMVDAFLTLFGIAVVVVALWYLL
jgi:hypothetical protein